ncbi:MAG: hypothetical protein V3T65_00665 [Acidobacteriota bacterium]
MWIKTVKPVKNKGGRFKFLVTFDDGAEIEVSAAEIQTARVFQRAVLSKLGKIFHAHIDPWDRDKQGIWERFIARNLVEEKRAA